MCTGNFDLSPPNDRRGENALVPRIEQNIPICAFSASSDPFRTSFASGVLLDACV